MKLSKLLLCLLSVIVFFTSCKNDDNKPKQSSVTMLLSFATTNEVDALTTRQYEIMLNGQVVRTNYITGAIFSKTEVVSNFDLPAIIDIKTSAALTAQQVPEKINVLNTYNITLKTIQGGIGMDVLAQTPHTITQDLFHDFLEGELTHESQFKVNEDGSLTRLK